jgi:Flp pilus assembly protein TadG
MQKFVFAVAREDERGASAVEFALVAPFFVLLVLGTIFICIQLFIVGSLEYAVEEGARCASVKTTICTNSATTVAYTQTKYFGPNVSPVFSYTATACGNSVTGSVNYTVNIGIVHFALPVTASACYP